MNIIIRAIIFCTIILITSCGNNKEFTLYGELSNKKEKYIYAIYDDPIAKIDTIKPSDGKFEYTFIPDTITIFRLVNDSGIALPIFADKNWNVKFKGSFRNPGISGNGPNDELAQFREECKKDTSNVYKLAKDFILKNRMSYASAYIFNEFFIQKKNPNPKELEEIIAQMDGHVKDCRVVDIIQKELSDNKENTSEYLNYFSSKDRSGKYVGWSSKEELYTLVNIWASWDNKSLQQRDSLYKKLTKLPKENFRVLNISMDFDKEEWIKNCKQENEQWIETCDFKGWQNPIIKQMGISGIPHNILVTKNRKIISSCIYGDRLIEKVDSLIQENKKNK